MKYYVVCDYRDNFPNYLTGQKVYNDHFSKLSVDEIVSTIKQLNQECAFFGGVKDIINAINSNNSYSDCIFLNFNDGLTQLHKRGQTPILLEMLSVAYSGSDPFTSLLVSDKYCTKEVIKKTSSDIKTPESILIFPNLNPDLNALTFKYPVIVKPNNEGSSIGIDQNSVCYNIDDLKDRIMNLKKFFNNILIEEYIEGFEFTVFIVGNENSVINQPLAIALNNKFYFENDVCDADAKCNHKRQYFAPETLLSSQNVNKLKSIAKHIFDTLHIKDYARLDFRYKNSNFYFIEANTVPAISSTSDVGEICKLLHISFREFISILLQTVNKRLQLQMG